MLLMQDAFASN